MSNTSSCSNDYKSPLSGYKERRREAHTQAEQKRRDAIKKGYENLQQMVPTCQQQDFISSYKLSKATILQRSIDHIHHLKKMKVKQENELKSLRKEVCALQIMRENYEQMLNQQQQLSVHQEQSNQMNSQVKFQIFQAFCDNLFLSFEQYVSFKDFKDLSSSVFTWLEERCTPQTLKEICLGILQDFFTNRH